MFRRWAIAGAVLALATRSDVALSAQIVTPDAEPRSLTLSDGVLAMKQGSDFIAFEILARYAQLGYRVAEADLAGLYMSGRGTPQDLAAARQLYQRAAAQGLPLAFGRLGAIYQNGIGVERDPKSALSWFRRGADASDPGSLFGLALMYQNGDGVKMNPSQAAKFCTMAAMRGYAKAQFMLGVMYFQGSGVPRDLVEAYTWFELAGPRLPPGGDRERSQQATSLIAAELTPEQIAAARDRVAHWQPLAD